MVQLRIFWFAIFLFTFVQISSGGLLAVRFKSSKYSIEEITFFNNYQNITQRTVSQLYGLSPDWRWSAAALSSDIIALSGTPNSTQWYDLNTGRILDRDDVDWFGAMFYDAVSSSFFGGKLLFNSDREVIASQIGPVSSNGFSAAISAKDTSFSWGFGFTFSQKKWSFL